MNKTMGISAALLVLLVLAGSIYVYQRYFLASRLPIRLNDEQRYVYIPTGASFEQVLDSLQRKELVTDPALFRSLADYMEYKRDPMRSGRFAVQGGWTLDELIRHLRNGEQAPVDLVLTNERLLENVAAKAARFIEPDSITLLRSMRDPSIVRQLGYRPETLMSMFIPNTYELYWNTNPDGFLKRMQREHDKFWAREGRTDRAKAMGMSPVEIYTLASIVEKETQQNSEKRRMAGVYLNRLRKGMLLQADPTAVFARRDFGARRVTDYHTKFDSPYNTYLYTGLPPGPIAMASIASIDAVLRAEEHDYLYFCARGDGSGLHAFAKNLAEHNRNAANYRANLRRRGLR